MGASFAALASELPLLAAGAGLALSGVSAESALLDMLKHGTNGCNKFSLAMSLLGMASGFGGIMGGPPSLQPAYAFANGGSYSLAVQGAGAVSQGLTGLGTIGLVNMMSDDDWERGPSNKEQGQAGEEQARNMIEKSGLEILGEQVGIRIKTTLGNRIRIVDFLVVDGKGKVFAVEVKTGNSELSPRQIKLDNLMRTQGGVITNPNVPPRYFNLKLASIETIYIRLP